MLICYWEGRLQKTPGCPKDPRGFVLPGYTPIYSIPSPPPIYRRGSDYPAPANTVAPQRTAHEERKQERNRGSGSGFI